MDVFLNFPGQLAKYIKKRGLVFGCGLFLVLYDNYSCKYFPKRSLNIDVINQF